jgi:hypothetical protein
MWAGRTRVEAASLVGGCVGQPGGTDRAAASSGAWAGIGGAPIRVGRLEVGGGTDVGGSEAAAPVRGSIGRRRWWRRKLFKTKWWAHYDCWLCREKFRAAV